MRLDKGTEATVAIDYELLRAGFTLRMEPGEAPGTICIAFEECVKPEAFSPASSSSSVSSPIKNEDVSGSSCSDTEDQFIIMANEESAEALCFRVGAGALLRKEAPSSEEPAKGDQATESTEEIHEGKQQGDEKDTRPGQEQDEQKSPCEEKEALEKETAELRAKLASQEIALRALLEATRTGDKNPLHTALKAEDSWERAEALLDIGADPYADNEDKKSPLWTAAKFGGIGVARRLVHKVPDIIHHIGSAGRSELHWAIYNGDLALASLLRELGGDCARSYRSGQNSLDVALERKQVGLVEWVLLQENLEVREDQIRDLWNLRCEASERYRLIKLMRRRR